MDSQVISEKEVRITESSESGEETTIEISTNIPWDKVETCNIYKSDDDKFLRMIIRFSEKMVTSSFHAEQLKQNKPYYTSNSRVVGMYFLNNEADQAEAAFLCKLIEGFAK